MNFQNIDITQSKFELKLLSIIFFRISNFATANIGESTYIFGGYDGKEDVDDVARLTKVDACPDDSPGCPDSEKIPVKGKPRILKLN